MPKCHILGSNILFSYRDFLKPKQYRYINYDKLESDESKIVKKRSKEKKKGLCASVCVCLKFSIRGGGQRKLSPKGDF